jgi:hypothetical protein
VADPVSELPAVLQDLLAQAFVVAEYVRTLEEELERHRAVRRKLRRLGRRAEAAGGSAR